VLFCSKPSKLFTLVESFQYYDYCEIVHLKYSIRTKR